MLVKVFDRARSSMWIYYLVGYGAPACIVALCVALSEGVAMGGYGTEYYCWWDGTTVCDLVIRVIQSCSIFLAGWTTGTALSGRLRRRCAW